MPKFMTLEMFEAKMVVSYMIADKLIVLKTHAGRCNLDLCQAGEADSRDW